MRGTCCNCGFSAGHMYDSPQSCFCIGESHRQSTPPQRLALELVRSEPHRHGKCLTKQQIAMLTAGGICRRGAGFLFIIENKCGW
jgi:hypothetical protein